MKKSLLSTVMIAAALCVLAAATAFATDAIEIQLAPATLDLSSPGDRLTVHTNVQASLVDGSSLLLTGPAGSLEPCAVYVDATGCIVSKYMADTIVVIGENEMTLTGSYRDGGDFAGSGILRVQE